MPTPDAIDEAFAVAANQIINNAVELARQLISTHQAAIAIVINKDWHYVRNFFSLSEKYAGAEFEKAAGASTINISR